MLYFVFSVSYVSMSLYAHDMYLGTVDGSLRIYRCRHHKKTDSNDYNGYQHVENINMQNLSNFFLQ